MTDRIQSPDDLIGTIRKLASEIRDIGQASRLTIPGFRIERRKVGDVDELWAVRTADSSAVRLLPAETVSVPTVSGDAGHIEVDGTDMLPTARGGYRIARARVEGDVTAAGSFWWEGREQWHQMGGGGGCSFSVDDYGGSLAEAVAAAAAAGGGDVCLGEGTYTFDAPTGGLNGTNYEWVRIVGLGQTVSIIQNNVTTNYSFNEPALYNLGLTMGVGARMAWNGGVELCRIVTSHGAGGYLELYSFDEPSRSIVNTGIYATGASYVGLWDCRVSGCEYNGADAAGSQLYLDETYLTTCFLAGVNELYLSDSSVVATWIDTKTGSTHTVFDSTVSASRLDSGTWDINGGSITSCRLRVSAAIGTVSGGGIAANNN